MILKKLCIFAPTFHVADQGVGGMQFADNEKDNK